MRFCIYITRTKRSKLSGYFCLDPLWRNSISVCLLGFTMTVELCRV